MAGWRGRCLSWQGHRHGVTIARGAAGPLARVGTGHGWAGQPLAGHRAMEAEATVAGVVGCREMLLVPGRDRAPGPRAAGEGGCSRRARVRASRERLRRGGPAGGGSYRDTAGSTFLAAGLALDRAAVGSGEPGTARCRSATDRWTTTGPISGGRSLFFPPPSWRASSGLPKSYPFPPGLLLPLRQQTHQTATQAARVGGVGEVCSTGVLFPAKGTS